MISKLLIHLLGISIIFPQFVCYYLILNLIQLSIIFHTQQSLQKRHYELNKTDKNKCQENVTIIKVYFICSLLYLVILLQCLYLYNIIKQDNLHLVIDILSRQTKLNFEKFSIWIQNFI